MQFREEKEAFTVRMLGWLYIIDRLLCALPVWCDVSDADQCVMETQSLKKNRPGVYRGASGPLRPLWKRSYSLEWERSAVLIGGQQHPAYSYGGQFYYSSNRK